jgi:demethylmenaquinone methyltransferase/2-methoxy-6-polyprenyl-1,4-benzoquinol methylase
MVENDNNKVDFGFSDIPLEDKTSRVGDIFSKVAPKYDLMNDVMSLGMHRCWKQYLIKIANIKPDYKVCDLASGTGDVALLIASKLGVNGEITLSDINPDMLKIGRDKIFDKGLIKKAKTVVANAEQLPFADNSFDLVTMAFGLRNVTDKKQALREMYRIIKPGGMVLVMEFSAPENRLIQSLYDKYSFNIIPKLGEFFANDGDSYQYLVESIRRHPNQDTLRDWFYESKFDECKIDNILSGVVAIHKGYKF